MSSSGVCAYALLYAFSQMVTWCLKRPGRTKALSSVSGKLMAAMTMTPSLDLNLCAQSPVRTPSFMFTDVRHASQATAVMHEQQKLLLQVQHQASRGESTTEHS